MTRRFLAAAALLLAGLPARAETPRVGVGVIAGVPFGATGKVWFDDRRAVQTHIGVSDGDLVWDADYLLHFDNILPRKKPDARLPLYAGLGFKYKAERETFAGIRFVGGLAAFNSKHGLEFFAEVAPVLRLAPRSGGALDGGVGLRKYF